MRQYEPATVIVAEQEDIHYSQLSQHRPPGPCIKIITIPAVLPSSAIVVLTVARVQLYADYCGRLRAC